MVIHLESHKGLLLGGGNRVRGNLAERLRHGRGRGHHRLRLGDRLLLGLLGRGDGEHGLLGGGHGRGLGRGRGRGATATQHLLNLAGVVARILLAHGGEVVGLLLGDAADLSGLGADRIRSVLEVVVDELLVGGVDEGNEEGDGGADNSQAPVGHELDQVVGDEGGDAGLGLSVLTFG